MKLEDLNLLLKDLDEHPGRDQVIKTAFALLEWLGVKPNKGGKEKLLAPKKEELKKYLTRHPVTNQFQLYRITADDEPITIRLAFLKKLRKDQLSQLVDKEGVVHFQGAPPIIQSLPSAPAYTFHIVATPEHNRLYVILNKGDQKRIIPFRKRLTQTQFQKILPQWQTIGIKSKPEIAEVLWKSLDLKEVNKEFYKQIKEKFDALIGIARIQLPKSNEEEVKQFAVRLIGRYIFCWFLKEKGIISEKLLSSSTIHAHRKDYSQKYLYQLFFNTLNEEVPGRNPFKAEGGLETLYDSIPYLNGGLFETHPEDKLFKVLDLNDWLIAFVKVLEDFDFTVDESSTQYQLVSIDPEMLGRIFENLMASLNLDTEKMANQRKAFGAFYTPREIVDYMVNQALKSYLEEALLPKDETMAVEEPLVEYKGTLFQDTEPRQTLITFDPARKAIADQRRKRLQDHIDKFFSPDCTSNPFDKKDTILVKQKLSEVKVLDPACGSGAFPMGMLLRLMELRQIVGHGHRNNYDLKNEILSRNIYGVDIMPMAVAIARLRAWLSLVLETDYKPQERKNNFGVSALPNLDFKFVCANSLIGSGYEEFSKLLDQRNATLDTLVRLDSIIKRLEEIRDEYFDPKGDKNVKENLQKEFKKLQTHITNDFESVKKNWKLDDFFDKIGDWNPFDDSHPSTFFSPGWMFGIKRGFDIVIGNPPYVQMQKNNGHLANQLKDAGYSTYERMGDVYAIFYELGFKLLRQSGVHTFITSSQWLKASYGRSLRQLFLSKNPLKLIALGPGIFESAVVDTNILLVKNEKNQNELLGSTVDNPEQLNHLSELKYHPMPYVSMERWVIMSDGKQGINTKITIKGKALKQWNVKINFGVKTGFNEAFLIDETKREELIKKDAKSAEIIKPILRGRDIDKYHTEWDGSYVITTFPALEIDITKFKSVKKYLESFSPRINQTGETYINKEGEEEQTRKKTGNKWFETQDQIGYHEEFAKEKIIWKNIGTQVRFTYSDDEIYGLDTTCIATGEKIKYLCALLNSKLCIYQLLESAPKTGMGDLKTSVQAIEPLLVYYPSDKEQTQIEKFVDEILKRKKANQDTTSLEKEIDIMVYKLYELTYEEVKIIDNDFWMSEEEYENRKV